MIRDIIKQCYDGKPNKRGLWKVDCIAVHRILFPGIDDPVEIARQFVDNPQAAAVTGGNIAYSYLLPDSDDIFMCLPLREVGAHAAVWNHRALGIGVIGDFRIAPPTDKQYNNLVDLCALLMPAHGLHPLNIADHGNGNGVSRNIYQLSGHSELPGGFSDPEKRMGGKEECPGPYLPMPTLRHDVNAMILAQAQKRVRQAGIVA